MSPYDVLGVSPEASDEDLNRAYKRLAKRYHPDLNPNDEAASRRMGEINRAYEEIKALRREAGPDGSRSAYAAAWEEVSRARYRGGRYTASAPRFSVGMLLAAVVMFFLVRLLLNLLFGGYVGAYYAGGVGRGGILSRDPGVWIL